MRKQTGCLVFNGLQECNILRRLPVAIHWSRGVIGKRNVVVEATICRSIVADVVPGGKVVDVHVAFHWRRGVIGNRIIVVEAVISRSIVADAVSGSL